MVNQRCRSPSANRRTSKGGVRSVQLLALGTALCWVSGDLGAATLNARKGPYIQDLSATSVEIRVELEPGVPAELELSSGPGSAVRVGAAPGADALQRFVATNLTPKTAYRYRLVVPTAASAAGAGGRSSGKDGGQSGDGGTLDGAFTTAPAPDEPTPIHFVVYGDNRTDDAAHAAVVRAIGAAVAPTDFLVHTGDFVEDGSDDGAWQRFFSIERTLLRDHVVFTAIGNHELVRSAGENYLRFFGSVPAAGAMSNDRRRFVRSVRWGAARFLFLNAMDTFTSTDERKWLDRELAQLDAEAGITFRFVVLHHGPYSSGPHGNNPRIWNSGLVDAFREHRIDVVFSGHDHLYERGEGKGFKYVVSGGGGAPLYEIKKRLPSTRFAESTFHYVDVKLDGQSFEMEARRLDGSILDRCGFAKGGTWDCDKAASSASTNPSPSDAAAVGRKNPANESSSSNARCGCEIPGAPTAKGGPWRSCAAFVFFAAAACRRARRSRSGVRVLPRTKVR